MPITLLGACGHLPGIPDPKRRVPDLVVRRLGSPCVDRLRPAP
jgi:hypothetical protein